MPGLLLILLSYMVLCQQGHTQDVDAENEQCHVVTKEYQSVQDLIENLFKDLQIPKAIQDKVSQSSATQRIHLTINIFKNKEKLMEDTLRSNFVTSPSETTPATMEHDEKKTTGNVTNYCAKVMVYETHNKNYLMEQLKNVWKSLEDVLISTQSIFTTTHGYGKNKRQELQFNITSGTYIPFADFVQHYRKYKSSDESFYGLPFPCDWKRRFFGKQNLVAYKVFDDKTNFIKGREQCKRFGARLAKTILSNTTMVLQTQLRKDKMYWVGVQDNKQPCNYTSKQDLLDLVSTPHESANAEKDKDFKTSDECTKSDRTGNTWKPSCECNYGYICELL